MKVYYLIMECLCFTTAMVLNMFGMIEHSIFGMILAVYCLLKYNNEEK